MRQLQAHAHGEPTDVLHLADVADAPLAETEVRIASEAVGLNFLDLMRCRGDYPLPPAFPLTFGVEVAGRVVEAGGGADVAVGTDVIACPTLPRGALGDHVVVDAAYVVERPADVGAIDGAALPVTYQTAWFALRRAGVGEGIDRARHGRRPGASASPRRSWRSGSAPASSPPPAARRRRRCAPSRAPP